MTTTLRLAIILAATWTALLLAVPAAAQPLPGSLLPYPDPPEMQAPGLGYSLAVDGEWMIVGAPGRLQRTIPDRQCAIIYRRGPDGFWAEHQRLCDPYPYSSFDSNFGRAVAISGDLAAVGSGPNRPTTLLKLEDGEWTVVDQSSPKAGRSRRLEFSNGYLFVLQSSGASSPLLRHAVLPQFALGPEETVVASGVQTFDALGEELLWTGPGVFVSRHVGNEWIHQQIGFVQGLRDGGCLLTEEWAFANESRSTVFVAKRDGEGWVVQPPLVLAGSFVALGQSFASRGAEVFLTRTADMDRVPTPQPPQVSEGEVLRYSLVEGAWQHEESIPAYSPWDAGGFGHSIAWHDDQLIVGSPGAGQNNNNPNAPDVPERWGFVHILEQTESGWSAVQSLDGYSSGPTWGNWGSSLALAGEYLYVGAPNDGFEAQSLGTVSVYRKELAGVHWVATIHPEPGDSFDFGAALAADGERLVVTGKDTQELFIYNQAGEVFSREATFTFPHPLPLPTSYLPGILLDIEGDVLASGLRSSLRPLVMARFNGVEWVTEALLPLETSAGAAASLQDIDLEEDMMLVAVRGAVYLYIHNGVEWLRQQEITGPVGSETYFGRQVGFIDGGVAVGLYDEVAELGNVVIYDFVDGDLVESGLVLPTSWMDLRPMHGSFATSANAIVVGTSSPSHQRLLLRENGVWRAGVHQPFLQSSTSNWIDSDGANLGQLVTDGAWVFMGAPNWRYFDDTGGGTVVAWETSQQSTPTTSPLNPRVIEYHDTRLNIGWDPDLAFAGRVSLFLDEAPATPVTAKGGALCGDGEVLVTGLLPDRAYNGAAAYQTIGGIGPQAPFTAITNAAIPFAPTLDQETGTSMRVKVVQGSNRPETLVAVRDFERQLYIQSDGTFGPAPHWRPVAEWTEGVVAAGLEELTAYHFAARALGQNGNETGLGITATRTTLDFTAPRTRVLGPAEPIVASGFPGSYTVQVDLQLDVEFTGAAPASTVISVSTDGVDFAPVQTLGAGVTTFTLLLEDYDLAAPGELRVRASATDTSSNVEVPDPADDLVLSIQRGPGPHNSFVVQ